jgi:L-fuconolactonase
MDPLPSDEPAERLPLIDSHCHAWTVWPYEPSVPDPEHRGSVDQLIWEMDQSGVSSACLVAANIERNPDNNAYIAACVQRYPDRLHHIAHIDCFWEPTYVAAGAADRLSDLVDRFRPVGITKYFGAEVTDWPVSDEGMAFFGRAERLGLIVSLAARPGWQPQLREVARRFPGLPILLHHLGSFRSPGTTIDQAFDVLAGTLEHENVYVKLSGFHYGAATSWNVPQVEAVAFARRIHDITGGRRLCWGSDYPVVKRDRSFTYQQTIEMVRTHCSFLSADDLPYVLGGTVHSLLQARRASP